MGLKVEEKKELKRKMSKEKKHNLQIALKKIKMLCLRLEKKAATKA